MKPRERIAKVLGPRLSMLGSSLLFAAVGTGILGLGVSPIWRTLERDNAASVQQSIGDTGSMLAQQVRLEVDRLKRVLMEVGELRIKPRLALSQAADALIESDPELLTASLWRKSAAGVERAYVGINPRYSGAAVVPTVVLAAVEAHESSERAWIAAALRGRAGVYAGTLPGSGIGGPIALLVAPFGAGHGDGAEVLTAWINLQKLQKLFVADGLVQSELIDGQGTAIARSISGHPLAPLFGHLEKADSGGVGIQSGIQELLDENQRPFYGGFRRISHTGLVVLSSIPADEADSSIRGVRRQMLAYLTLVFLILAGLCYVWQKRGGSFGRLLALKALRVPRVGSRTAEYAEFYGGEGPSLRSESTDSIDLTDAAQATGVQEVVSGVGSPRRVAVVAMHGSMRGFNQLVESGGAAEAADALNDFLAFSAPIVRASGGHFECESGASFGAAWEIADGASAATASAALRCALLLRQELARLNEARKVDGKKTLRYELGMHVGQAVRARLGVVPDLKDSIAGEAPACARALDRMALSISHDLVVSHEVLQTARGVFFGTALGESRLTADTGLIACYSIHDFKEEASLAESRFEPTGQAISIDSPDAPGSRLTGGETRQLHVPTLVGEKRISRWLVNNGSQIVGPFSAEQLARMLFAQELDFDCECWHEETGRASKLESAGVFSGGSQDAGASFWVFDGKLIHGPVTDGFIRTALTHGAFGPDAWVCEMSTIAGWNRLGAAPAACAEAAPKTRKPETGSGDEAA